MLDKMASKGKRECVWNCSPTMTGKYLASSTNILSDSMVRSLVKDLHVNKEQLARELGYSPQSSGMDGLYYWCKSPGSTIFVLVSVLTNLGRTDCVHRIEQYLQMHLMQLFIKVEEAAVEGRLYVTNPKFYQLTTSCEFTLVQALENILGGDLVHYEITGPGSWVTWTTLAKELKGQQLTLLYHIQPISHTIDAIYGPTKSDTNPKQPVVQQNIPANTDITQNDQTEVKAFHHTEIESLKLGLDSCVPSTNSNNITTCDSLDFESIAAEGETQTNVFSTHGYQSCKFTLDSQTQTKVLVVSKNNTPEYTQVLKVFSDKDISSMNGNQDSTVELNPLQVLNNVPNFSRMEKDSFSNSSNSANSMLQTAQTPHSLTTLRLPLQTDQKVTPQNEDAKKQNNLNNLSCMTMTSSPHNSYSHNSQAVNKITISDTSVCKAVVNPESGLSQFGTVADNMMNEDASPSHSSGLPDMDISMFHTDLAASSLFTQNRKAQHINVSMYYPSGDYVPHNCIQNLEGQLHNIDCVAAPLPCCSTSLATTPPQKRHRFDGVTPSRPEQLVQQHCQLQYQALMEKKTLELQQQLQQSRTFGQNASSNSGHVSAIDSENHTQQLLQYHQPTVSQQSRLLQQQTIYKRTSSNEPQQNSSHQQGQAISQSLSAPCCPVHQFHLPLQSHQQPLQSHQQSNQQLLQSHQQQLQSHQQPLQSHQHPLQSHQQPLQSHQQPLQSHQQESHCGIQSLNQSFSISHNHPLRYSDEMTEQNCHQVSGFGQRQLRESQVFRTSLNQQSNAALQFEEQASHMINTDSKGKQCVAVLKPPILGGSSSMPTFIRSQVTNFDGLPTSVMLPNYEFTVRLPQTDSNTRAIDQQVFLNHGSQFRNASGSSSNGSSTNSGGVFTQSGIILMQKSEHGTSIASAPLHASPSRTDIQFSHIGGSVNSGKSKNSSSNDGISTDEEGYNFIDNGHCRTEKPLSASKWPSPAIPKRAGFSLDTELLNMEGWCPDENGDTIQNTMEKYRPQDGSFVVWKSRRFSKFVISVSHLNKLFHFRVEETKHENKERTIYYLFEGGFRSESLLDLLQHYRQNSIRISVPSTSGTKTYIEHIQLHYPIKSTVKRKDTSRSS